MNITKDITYVGVNDRDIDLFEGQYTVENGMAYNSYVLTDEKTAVFDTVDARFGNEWLGNVERALGGRTPDYLIVLRKHRQVFEQIPDRNGCRVTKGI